MIWRSKNYDGLTFRQNLVWVGAAGTGALAGEIIHGAVMPFYEPVFECGVVWGWVRSCHASQDESQLACFVFDRLF